MNSSLATLHLSKGGKIGENPPLKEVPTELALVIHFWYSISTTVGPATSPLHCNCIAKSYHTKCFCLGSNCPTRTLYWWPASCCVTFFDCLHYPNMEVEGRGDLVAGIPSSRLIVDCHKVCVTSPWCIKKKKNKVYWHYLADISASILSADP